MPDDLVRIEIPNWKDLQHYKDRNPPWIKLHRSLLDDPDWHDLPASAARVLIGLQILASEFPDGIIALTPRKLAFRLRCASDLLASDLKSLRDSDMIIIASSALASCYTEERRGEAEREGEGEGEGETEAEEILGTSSNGVRTRSSGPPPEVTKQVTEHTDRRKAQERARAAAAQVVFRYWAERVGKDPKRTVFDAKRRTRLMARLKENHDNVAELLSVVDAAVTDEFHMGNNDRGTQFLEIQTLFRDRESVEKLAPKGPHYDKPVHPYMQATEQES